LREIVVFIARDDPQAARRFGHLLIDQALAIGEFPEMGRTVPELGTRGGHQAETDALLMIIHRPRTAV
jgi:plasmid stabilization system protein ParE